MASKKKNRKKAEAELSEEKIVGIAFIITVVIIGMFMLLSSVTIGPAAKEIKTEMAGYWGAPGDLNQPFGIAVSPDNSFIYLDDAGNDKVIKVRQMPDNTFRLDGKFGGTGDKKGEFNQPSGISTDKAGNVYVADAHNNRIQKFDDKGKYISSIDLSMTGFWRPRNVMAGSSGTVYIANTGKYNLYRFGQAGQMTGDVVNFPGEVFGLAEDSQGRVYVASLGDRAVEVFDKKFDSIKKIKMASWIPNKGLAPMIAVDSKDRLYCVSELEQCVYVFDTKLKNFPVIGVIKNDAKKQPLFDGPLGIAVDSLDFVYVTDKALNRVVKLRPIFK
jgi:DNA-binding beta-propeller fold protein YncE